jgi:chaperonin GroES
LNIQPLADHVVIKPSEESEEKTKSGLYVPDTAKEKPQEGQGELIPMNVAVGDKVIYKKYAGNSIKYDGEELLILGERDILAKLV